MKRLAMSKYKVERSIVIAYPKKKVLESLKDFSQWPHWSPWLKLEPDAKVCFSDNMGEEGSNYTWDGEQIGIGSMALVEVAENALEMHILFIKPHKSQAKVFFILEEEAEGTKVTWKMFFYLPWYMFFMARKMEDHLGRDYERGLVMLKSYLETGTVPSEVQLDNGSL